MKFSLKSALVVTLAAEATVASSWFSKAGMSTSSKRAIDSRAKRDTDHNIMKHVKVFSDAARSFFYNPNVETAVELRDAGERLSNLNLDGIVHPGARDAVQKSLNALDAAKERYVKYLQETGSRAVIHHLLGASR